MFCFALGSLLHMVSQMIYDLCSCFYAERSGAKAWKDLISVTHLLREDETYYDNEEIIFNIFFPNLLVPLQNLQLLMNG